jgi:hypothetical protein
MGKDQEQKKSGSQNAANDPYLARRGLGEDHPEKGRVERLQ